MKKHLPALAMIGVLSFCAPCGAIAAESQTEGDKALSEALGRLEKSAGALSEDLAVTMGILGEKAKLEGAALLNRLSHGIAVPEAMAKELKESNVKLLGLLNRLRAMNGKEALTPSAFASLRGEAEKGGVSGPLAVETVVQKALIGMLETEAAECGSRS